VVVDSLDVKTEVDSADTGSGASTTDLTGTITARMFTGAAPATVGGTSGGAATPTPATPPATTQTGTDS
jgi:hypothetical protein